MDEVKKAELTSAAAFVEGGVQEACEDSCSICLEGFCDSDPSTVTTCKHEFHLQCVLEWSQRSSNCPMCWQILKLKDATSQELLDAVEHERNLRSAPPRSTSIFRHPTLGDFEFQSLPVGVNNSDLEERIMRHLAAAAAMDGTHRRAQREGTRGHPARARSPFVVYSPQSDDSIDAGGEEEEEEEETFKMDSRDLGSSASDNRNQAGQPSSPHRDGAGPSELHSFSDTWRSRFGSLSSKYKESISRSTKELKEKVFSHSPTMAEIGATVSRMMERLETRDNSVRAGPHVTRANGPEGSQVANHGS